MRKLMLSISITAIVVMGVLAVTSSPADGQDMAFGGPKDVEFAEKTWKAMGDYEAWPLKSGYYPGQSPHGKFLRMYYNMIHVDGKPYHIIVKDNYGGEGATMETVSESPDEYLAAVTIMLQRDEGYDNENNNWFWVKYGPNGKILSNPQGVALAGRVAKGSEQGCISCHANAKGGDFLFSNDR